MSAQGVEGELQFERLSDGKSFSAVARGVELAFALEKLVSTTEINLLYTSELVKGKDAYCVTYGAEADELLRCILSQTSLDFYQMSSGTYVLIEHAEEKPQFGRLAGIVLDQDTGEPLPFANVLIADASTGTATNEAGMFSFADLLPGPHLVEASYVGYESSSDSIWVAPGGGIQSRIMLKTKPIMADPIIVNGLQQRIPSRSLGSNEAEEADFFAPGGLTADVARSMKQYLGVSMQSPLADLHIQGSESSEHQMTLDGVRIFNPVALGRMLGAFSPLSIGRLTVHKAGYGVRHGSQLSGVVAAEHVLNGRERQIVSASIDPLSANVRFNTVFSEEENKTASLMAAVRLGVWDLYKSPQLSDMLSDWASVDQPLTSQILQTGNSGSTYESVYNQSSVGFADFHAASRISLGPFQKLYISGYYGQNDIGTELQAQGRINPETDSTRFLDTFDGFNWENLAGQVRHEWLIGTRAIGMLRVRGSRHTLDHTYELQDTLLAPGASIAGSLPGTAGITSQDRNTISEAAFDGTLDYSFSSRHHLAIGFEALYRSTQISLNSSFFRPVEVPIKGWTYSAFIEDKLSLGLNTLLELGTRVTHVGIRNKTYVEPRASLRFDYLDGGISSRLAFGLYRQFLNEFDLSTVGPSEIVPSIRFWYPVDETLAPPKAYHLANEYLWSPSEGWTVNLEAFYKWQPRILTLNYPVLLGVVGTIPQDNTTRHAHYIEASKGFAYGIGTRIERSTDDVLVSAAYSYNQAKRTYTSRFEGETVPVPWLEPHRLNVSADYFLSDRLTLRARWYGVWGRSWGFRQAYYDWLNAHAGTLAFPPFNLNEPEAHTLPAMYQLDLGVSYTALLGQTRLQFRADLVNVLDQENVVDWSIGNAAEGTSFARVPRTLPGIQPVFALNVSL